MEETLGENGQISNLVSEEGKNSKPVVCQRCQSKVLRPGIALHLEKEFFLPHMKKKAEGDTSTGESLKHYWLVGDMYAFENVGFSKTVANLKYLLCADCEVGPIGWHDIREKDKFYVALDRVHYSTD